MSTSPPPRSLLAAPAVNPRYLQSALRSRAGAVIPYLEDAVAAGANDAARAEIVCLLGDPSAVNGPSINAVAAGGVWALAGPWIALDDESGLVAEVGADRALGFAGKLCIHPAQVAVVNEAFAPLREQQEWARRVLNSPAPPPILVLSGLTAR